MADHGSPLVSLLYCGLVDSEESGEDRPKRLPLPQRPVSFPRQPRPQPHRPRKQELPMPHRQLRSQTSLPQPLQRPTRACEHESDVDRRVDLGQQLGSEGLGLHLHLAEGERRQEREQLRQRDGGTCHELVREFNCSQESEDAKNTEPSGGDLKFVGTVGAKRMETDQEGRMSDAIGTVDVVNFGLAREELHGDWDAGSSYGPSTGGSGLEMTFILGDQAEEGAVTLEPGEFLVELEKDEGGTGLEIECFQGTLVIAQVHGGSAARWNEAHLAEPHCMWPGDRIVSVNCFRGEMERLVAIINKSNHLLLVIRRAVHFHVSLGEAPDRTLGLSVVGGNARLDMLKITGVSGGAIETWNKTHQMEVHPGDRITSVNGACKPQEMLAELRSTRTIEMTVIRLTGGRGSES